MLGLSKNYLSIFLIFGVSYMNSCNAADMKLAERENVPSEQSLHFSPKFSLIPDSTRQSLQTLRELGADHIDEMRMKTVISAPPPSSVDLSTSFDPIYDQGSLGSCTANALIAAINFGKNGTKKKSCLFLYAQERMMERPIGSNDEDAGASLSDGILALRKVGVCDESFWPYDTSTWHTPPLALPAGISDDQKVALAFENWSAMYRNAADYRLANLFANRDLDPKHTSTVARDINTMKLLLSLRGPIVGGIIMYDSFLKMDASTIVPLPKTSDSLLGGHAIVFAGYNDDKDLGNGQKGAFLIRNSWGPNWGTSFSGTSPVKGHFWLPYEYVKSDGIGHGPLVLDLWKVGEIGQTLNYANSNSSASQIAINETDSRWHNAASQKNDNPNTIASDHLWTNTIF